MQFCCSVNTGKIDAYIQFDGACGNHLAQVACFAISGIFVFNIHTTNFNICFFYFFIFFVHLQLRMKIVGVEPYSYHCKFCCK